MLGKGDLCDLVTNTLEIFRKLLANFLSCATIMLEVGLFLIVSKCQRSQSEDIEIIIAWVVGYAELRLFYPIK